MTGSRSCGCFGVDPEIVVPEVIGSRRVKRMAPYAFSARKDHEDEGRPYLFDR